MNGTVSNLRITFNIFSRRHPVTRISSLPFNDDVNKTLDKSRTILAEGVISIQVSRAAKTWHYESQSQQRRVRSVCIPTSRDKRRTLEDHFICTMSFMGLVLCAFPTHMSIGNANGSWLLSLQLTRLWRWLCGWPRKKTRIICKLTFLAANSGCCICLSDRRFVQLEVGLRYQIINAAVVQKEFSVEKNKIF